MRSTPELGLPVAPPWTSQDPRPLAGRLSMNSQGSCVGNVHSWEVVTVMGNVTLGLVSAILNSVPTGPGPWACVSPAYPAGPVALTWGAFPDQYRDPWHLPLHPSSHGSLQHRDGGGAMAGVALAQP